MGIGAKRSMLLGVAAIALSFCALTAFAAPSSENSEEDHISSLTNSLVYTIDANSQDNPVLGQFKSLQSALDAIPNNAGDVVFFLNSDLDVDSGAHIYEVPAQKSITSFTLASTVDAGVTIGKALYCYENNLYANGIPFTIGPHVSYEGSVYGGSHETPLMCNTSIVVGEGAKTYAVYGGSHNASLVGDTSIIVKGTVSSTVVGGGHASATSSSQNTVADIDGSTSIIIEQTGITKYVHGAGRAEAPSFGSASTSVRANVSGSATLQIAGATEQTNGGGFAGPSNYASSVENTQATANLGGNAKIVFEATAISSKDDWMNQVYGGGWAQGTESRTNRIVADVMGSTYVEALDDDTASSSQPNIKAFNALYGGGWALYCNAQANVEGDTLVKTARPNMEAREGLAGGGLASWGATANVSGTTCVEVFSITDQLPSYENAYLVVGGGIALCGVDWPLTYAQAGATKVVIHTGARLVSANSSGTNIIGGEFALSSNTNTDVAGSANVIVEDGITIQKRVIGGGVVFPSGGGGGFEEEGTASANVKEANISIGEGCTINQNVIGGGYIGSNTKNATADTGDIHTVIGTKTTLDSFFIGGSMVESSENNQADTATIKTILKDGVTISDRFVGGSYLYHANGSKANITGNVTTSIGNGSSINGNSATGGSFIWGSTNSTSDISGDVTTIAGDRVTTKSFAGGGMPYYGASLCSANVAGSITSEFGNNYIVSIGEFIGGGYTYYNTSSCSANADSVSTTFKDNASVKTIVGAGWARSGNSDSVNVTSSANLTFGDDASVTSSLFGGGSVDESANSSADSGAVSVSLGKRAQLSSNFIGAGNVYDSTNGHANTVSTNISLGSDSAISGWVECGGNVDSSENGATNVGPINTTLSENCAVQGSFVGGGYVYGGTGSQANAGDITTTFGSNCQISNWYEGGGFLSEGTQNHANAGNITTLFEDGCSVGGSLVSGGYLYKTNEGHADTGSITTTLKNNCSITNWMYGSSYASQSPGGHANASSVSTTIGDRFKLGAFFLGGSYAYGDGIEATVSNNIVTSIGNEAEVSGKYVIGGGLIEGAQSGTVEIGGNITTSLGNKTTTNNFVGGSMAWGPKADCNASVRGKVATTFGDDYTMASKGLSFVGGGYLYYGTEGSSCETTCGSVETHFGNNADLGTGQHWVTAAGSIAGTSSAGSVGIGIQTNSDNAVTFTTGTNFSAYLYAGGGILSGGTSAGSCTTAIVGNVESSFDGGDIKWFFGGAYLPDENGDGTITGNIANHLTGFTFPANNGVTLTGASSHAGVIGNVTTTLQDSTLGASPRLGGSNGAVSGDAKIVLDNVTFNETLKASSSTGIEGTQIYRFIGAAPYGKYLRAEQATGTLLIEIGDELGTPTTTTMLGVYDSAPDEAHQTNVLVHQNATLILNYGGTDMPYHLSGVNNLQVERDGKLAVPSCTAEATITGNLSGEGTISLPAGSSIAGSGTLDGALTLEVTGTPAIGQTYFDFSDQSTGSVSYTDPDKKLVLEKDDTTVDHTKWTMRELTYPVTFSLNDGTEAVFATQTIAHNQKVALPDPAPEREGYVFDGWFKDAEGTQTWDFDTDTVTGDLTLYAKWTLAEYTVSFEACGGFPVPLDLTVKHGTTITEPAQQPTKKDFVFAGWYTDAAYNGDPWDFDTDTVTGDMTLYAKWDDGITVNVEVAEDDQGDAHGTVDPATPQIFTGEPLQYTLTPNYGYRIETVTVDSTPLPVVMQADLRTGIVSYEPESPSTIVVTFVPLDNQATDDIVESLPAVTPDDTPEEVAKKTDTVLDAKLDYESMPEDKKETVKQETIDKLNDAVASLPNVDVEVDPQISTELASNIDIPDEYKSRFIGAVSKDEIEKLKTGATSALKVVMEIKDIDAPTDANEQTAFEGELGTYELGQHFLASVTKQLYKDKDSDPEVTPITTLPAPVKLAFDVPASLINKVDGTTRSFAMVRTHFDGKWQAALLDDEDEDATNEKVEVSTDRFSTYSIVYKDVHHVTFDSNGGSKVASQDIENNGSIVKPANPAREGFTFDGWYEAPDSSTAWDFATDKVTAPFTLYAKWVEEAPPAPTEYTVTFVANGGTPEPSAQTVVEGDQATEPTASEKTGYELDGWFSDEACTKAWDFATPVTTDLTLYAKWTPKTYTVTFEANGGSETPDQTVAYRGTVTEPADPTREGYTFAGWWKDAEFTSSWNFATDTISGPTTLYAKWIESVTPPTDTFAVVFDARGGSPVPETQTVDDGSTVEEPTAKPEKIGYEFGGWFSEEACTKAWDFSTPVTADLTLYAKWTAETYAVTFDADGGQPIPDEQTVGYGQLVQPVQAPEKEGFEFVAWYVDADLTVSWDFAHDVVEAPITLYAKWNKVPDEPKPPVDPVDPDEPDNPTPPVDPDEPDQPDNPTTPDNPKPTEPAKPTVPQNNGKQPGSGTHVEKPQADHIGKTLAPTGDALPFDMLAALAILGLSIAAATRVRAKRTNR